MSSYLAFPPLPDNQKMIGRLLSVALSLGSPPAAVSRYSCSVEPGLSSGKAFRRLSAAVQLTRIIDFNTFLSSCQFILIFLRK